ncbi:serine hydrolase domain-containing protein [Deinococcus yavapaiensis]|uniref:CubicO group peptidase (Beta-lactamase class C family) n=1 Tax=Deinococcus yavapaiensis KR-236 TaxID=694435 RepID=A0A318S814_9DEIO|nr:serine hydrolase domain-containing protein [Deinococcus yavapaiensis]PYE53878.1 CubicO group peptidase (beta-lactamase class C family) [Deinococcus yavapaiensis KR-236]
MTIYVQPDYARDVPADDFRANVLTRRIEEALARQHLPGLTVAVVGPEGPVYAHAFGRASVRTGRLMTTRTVIPWFSLTKLVTATATVRLAERGRLDLDAPVTDLLPELGRITTAPMTARHLLSHTSGLPNPLPLRWVHVEGDSTFDEDAFVQAVFKRVRRVVRQPGTFVRYSNIGYLALGCLIARASGQPFETYVQQEILSPLNMHDTAFHASRHAPRATGHHRLPRALTPIMRAIFPPGVIAGHVGGYLDFAPFQVNGAAYGGLSGSVTDASRFARMHLAGGVLDGARILSREATLEMRHLRAKGAKLNVGLGWFHASDSSSGDSSFVEHLGGGAGFWTLMRLYRDVEIAVVLMGNATRFDHDRIARLAHDVFGR